MGRILNTRVLTLLVLCCFPLAATTWYVDYSSGSDSYDGTGKTHTTGSTGPFKNAPAMQGCASTCASTMISAGDSLIFKGGVIWPNATMAWAPADFGNSGATGYIGVDQTWYSVVTGTYSVNCGSAFCRPIMDAGSALVLGGDVNNANKNIMWNLGNQTYVVIDNVEFRGFYYDTTMITGAGKNIMVASGSHIEMKNLYFHGWSANLSGGCCAVSINGTAGSDPGSSVHDSVWDGSDTTYASGGEIFAIYGSPNVVYRNYLSYLSSAFVGNFSLVYNNSITNVLASFDGMAHENGIESNTDVLNSASIGLVMYNNVLQHTAAPVVSYWSAPYNNATSYVFNNVCNDCYSNILDIGDPLATPYGYAYVTNNTAECGPDAGPPSATCTGNGVNTISGTYTNNHFITSNGTPVGNSGSNPQTVSNNLQQSKATANGQGYTTSQGFVFSPISASAGTVGYALNLISVCNSSALLAALCQDTSYGVNYNASTHTITGLGRLPANRPASGAWDIGAYNYIPPPGSISSSTGIASSSGVQ